MARLHAWVARTLATGRAGVAIALLGAATAVAALVALRTAAAVPFEQVAYGQGRSPAIDVLLGLLGTERTAVLVYLLERSWTALIAATALTPLLLCVLGSTAIHAAARLGGIRRPFAPVLVLFAFAAALTRLPADLATLLLPPVAGLIDVLATAGFGLMAWSALRLHYGLTSSAAVRTLTGAIVLFYVIPAVLIGVAVAAILVAAVWLEYVPPLRSVSGL